MATWVILGAGYTGNRLATRLVAQGERVIVTRRTEANALAAAISLGGTALRRVRGIAVDLRDPATLNGAIPNDSILVCTAPPGDDPDGEIEMLIAAARNARRIIYMSSTGVYGPAGGGWVDEDTPLAPHTRAGRARAAAESALAEDCVALRVAGIHGPGRGLVERIKAGTYRVIGDGSAHVSRIHVDDLVEAIIRAGTSDIEGPINIADDDPSPIGEVADAVAAHFGLPPPPRVPADAVDPEVAGMLTADRRIANRRMKAELGVKLRYPSWRSLLVVSIVLGAALGACNRPPDFRAFCEKAAPCEGKTVQDCMDTNRGLWQEQKERGCASEGTAIVECKIKYGQCETAWSLFMPTDRCLAEVHALGDCLAKNR